MSEKIEEIFAKIKPTKQVINQSTDACLKAIHQDIISVIDFVQLWLRSIQRIGRSHGNPSVFYTSMIFLVNDILQKQFSLNPMARKISNQFIDSGKLYTGFQKILLFDHQDSNNNLKRVIQVWNRRQLFEQKYLKKLQELEKTPLDKMNIAFQNAQLNDNEIEIHSALQQLKKSSHEQFLKIYKLEMLKKAYVGHCTKYQSIKVQCQNLGAKIRIECKNGATKAGKNDIIELECKIRQAQRAYDRKKSSLLQILEITKDFQRILFDEHYRDLFLFKKAETGLDEIFSRMNQTLF